MMKMLQILLVAGLLLKASTSHITGDGTSTAPYGGQAHYRCSVADPTGVLQVTWQRLFQDESIENLATYSRRFGQQVNEPYQEKVTFTKASLSSTSITLTNVTWEDESCYICSFNAYPDGSKRRQTCLTVQGISEVETGAHTLNSDHKKEDVEEVMFSCSATGKPAPTIEWSCSPGTSCSDQPQTTTASNSDHTFTSSSNITLQMPVAWPGHVDCVLNRGKVGQRQERIHFSVNSGNATDKEEEGKKTLSASGVALVVCGVMFVSCIVAAAAIKQKRI